MLFLQPDAFYHLRRATIFAANFPRLPTMDMYMAYPGGAECPWPPGYDLSIALISLLLGGEVNHRIIRLVTALLPPICAALCVFPLFRIARQIVEDDRWALLAAIFLTVMPGLAEYSGIGVGDHHAAETLLGLWFFSHALAAVRAAEEGRSIRRHTVLAGLTMFLGLMVWQGQIVFFSVWAAYVLFLTASRRVDGTVARYAALSSVIAGILAAALIALVRYFLPGLTETTRWDFGHFSYFQPAYLAVLSLGIAAWALLMLRRGLPPLRVAAGAFVAAAVTVAAVPPLRRTATGIAGFMLKWDPWYASINEFQSPFSRGIPRLSMDATTVLQWLYLAGSALPFVFSALILYRLWRGSGPARAEYLFYPCWTVLIGSAAMIQKRWGNAYSPILAMGFMLTARTVYGWIPGLLGGGMKRRRRRVMMASASTGVVLMLAVFLVPHLERTRSALLADPTCLMNPDLYNTLQWIGNYTPPTSHLWTPELRPEYAVMAPWDLGHEVQYIAGRPTVANNFGHQLPGNGFRDSIYIWSAESENEAADIMEKHGARFLFLDNSPFYRDPALAAYLKPGFFARYVGAVGYSGPVPVMGPREEYFRLPLPRLMEFDGSASFLGPALERFRLVFESGNYDTLPYHANTRGVRAYKLFELVRGVTVKGKAKAESMVYFRGSFMTNWDRHFFWEAAVKTGGDGRFEGVVPYATSEPNLFIRSIDPAVYGRYVEAAGKGLKFDGDLVPAPVEIFADGRVARLHTSNDDVLRGREVVLDMARDSDPAPGR